MATKFLREKKCALEQVEMVCGACRVHVRRPADNPRRFHRSVFVQCGYGRLEAGARIRFLRLDGLSLVAPFSGDARWFPRGATRRWSYVQMGQLRANVVGAVDGGTVLFDRSIWVPSSHGIPSDIRVQSPKLARRVCAFAPRFGRKVRIEARNLLENK